MSLPTLYIHDSNGKERQWSVHTEGAEVVVRYGQVGKKITEKRTTAKAKNLGKSNETTPEQQAVLEAESKHRQQIEREDYNENIHLAGKQLRPMLARDYRKVGHQVDWADQIWMVQPKLNGLRLVYGERHADVLPCELLTRKGEVYQVPHIEDLSARLLGILDMMTDHKVRGLDGELYLHGMPLGQISSLAKKYKAGQTDQLEYHLFDLVIEGLPFAARHLLLATALAEYENRHGQSCFRLVPTTPCTNEDQMKEFHGEFSLMGYEGIMIRSAESMYGMAQRPNCLYKYKEFMDEEFEIIGVWEDNNGNAMFKCANPKGVSEEHQTFDCTPKRTHAVRKEMLKNADKYIGKHITVQFQEWTEYMVPEFPVGLEFREVNDLGEPIA